MQFLSRVSLKLVAIIILISFLGLSGIQQANPQSRLPGISIDTSKITSEITQGVQTEIQSTIRKATEPYTTQVNTYLKKVDDYQQQLDNYQKQLNAIPATIEQQVDRSVSGVTQQVQGEINNITVQVRNKIDELKNEVNSAITSSIQTLTWGMLGIDGLMTAVITWFVVRRVTRQLNKEIANLTNIISGLETQISQSVESVADGVRNQIDTGITDSTSK